MNCPERLLLGPGPSPVPHSVLAAISGPTIGHLDPAYLALMDRTCEMLREIFRTTNALTFPVSGTGMAGMECAAVNLIEPGDEALVCINGVFGQRMRDVLQRCGATVHAIEKPFGESFAAADVMAGIERHPGASSVWVVHAETSTGAFTPLEKIGREVRSCGKLLVVDAVTSLGGHELRTDDWHIDAVYSGTQKCLNCPPGLAPVSFGPRALERFDRRRTKPQSWYLDVSMLRNYYQGACGGRVYHHTAPVNMTFALHQALTIVLEEGLDTRVARHAEMHLRLRAGLEKLGIGYIPDLSLHTLNCVRVPDGVDDLAVRRRLLEEFGIEIGGGLGPLAGKAWRIGLMGHGATPRNVETVLGALAQILR